MNTQLTFKSHSFTALEKENQVWITSKDLAISLGYANSKSVTDLFNKNSDEFRPNMSEVVESTTSGNYRKKTRIFSLRGAHLIAMLSRTAVAKEFRSWVLDILDEEIKKPIPTNKSLSKAQQEAEAIALLDKESFAKASNGAKDMNARKRAIKEVRNRVIEWENKYQIKLDMPMPSGNLRKLEYQF